MNTREPGFAPPGPAHDDPAPPRLVLPGRRARAAEGSHWIGDGWRLFRKATLMWVVFVVLLVIIHLALGMVPYAGGWLGNLVSPLFLGGLALGCRSLETGGELELEHLLAGFRRNTGGLFAIGVIYALGEVLLIGVVGLFAGLPLTAAILSGSQESILVALRGVDDVRLLVGVLVATLLAAPLIAAYWFSVPLAILHDMPALAAMKASLGACVRNILPMTVYGLLMTALAVLAALPLLLGMLAWLPLTMTSVYAGYRALFTEPDEDEP